MGHDFTLSASTSITGCRLHDYCVNPGWFRRVLLSFQPNVCKAGWGLLKLHMLRMPCPDHPSLFIRSMSWGQSRSSTVWMCLFFMPVFINSSVSFNFQIISILLFLLLRCLPPSHFLTCQQMHCTLAIIMQMCLLAIEMKINLITRLCCVAFEGNEVWRNTYH